MRHFYFVTLAVTLATLAAPSASRADGPKLPSPTLLLDLDARAYASEFEGLSGFALGRLRPGLRYAPVDWLSATAVIEYAGEHSEVLDAFVTLRPCACLAIDVGLAKPPLFPSHREPIHSLAFGDVTAVAKSLRVNRDLGIGARWSPSGAPVEVFARIGNGSSSFLGNDNTDLAYYLGADLVLDVSDDGDRVRVGATGLYEDAADRAGVGATTPLGFAFYRAPPVSGSRWVGEAHASALVGPLSVSIEAGLAREARSKDDDGNPSTPRRALDDDLSYGVSGELDWTFAGRRVEGRVRDPGAVDLGVRVERLWLSRDADDLVANGSIGGTLVAKWWVSGFLALSALANVTGYDVPAIEDPSRKPSWGAIVRASLFAGP